MISREETTLSHEEELQRDLGNLKRMKMTQLQHPVGSGLLRTPSQELSSKPSVSGKKRKSICGQPHEPMPKASHGLRLIPVELSDGQAPPYQLHMQQPPLQLPLDCQQSIGPSFQWSKDRQSQIQPPLHESQDLKALPRQSPGQEPMQQQFLNQQPRHGQVATVWCNVCQLNCVSHHNLKIHMQGKKHKAQWDMQSSKAEGNTKCGELSLQVDSRAQEPPPPPPPPPQKEVVLAWCSLCKVNCKNPQNLSRHLQGRKHSAKLDKQSPRVGRKARSDKIGRQSHRTVEEKQPPLIHTGPVWCTLCKLNCMNPQNLRRHLQGKKHRAKWDEQPLQAVSAQNAQPPEVQITPVWYKPLQIESS